VKKLLGTVLILSTSVLFFHEETIQIYGINFKLTPNVSFAVKIILTLIIFILAFGTYEEIKEKQIVNKFLLLFRGKFENYIKVRNETKIELKKIYPQITKTKCIYFIKDTMILKTTDVLNNDDHEAYGYLLKIKRIKYWWLLFINSIKVALNFAILPYIGLMGGSLLIVTALLVELACAAKVSF